jgi:hypothetical protein
VAECFQVATVLNFVDGTSVRMRTQAFETQADAERAIAEVGGVIQKLIEKAQIVVKMDDGKMDNPMTVAQFCASLGIQGIGHVPYKVPIHGALILTPPSGLIQLH